MRYQAGLGLWSQSGLDEVRLKIRRDGVWGEGWGWAWISSLKQQNSSLYMSRITPACAQGFHPAWEYGYSHRSGTVGVTPVWTHAWEYGCSHRSGTVGVTPVWTHDLTKLNRNHDAIGKPNIDPRSNPNKTSLVRRKVFELDDGLPIGASVRSTMASVRSTMASVR